MFSLNIHTLYSTKCDGFLECNEKVTKVLMSFINKAFDLDMPTKMCCNLFHGFFIVQTGFDLAIITFIHPQGVSHI